MKILNENETVWFSKYQPQQLEDCILPVKFKSDLAQNIKSDTLPNLAFFSYIGGTGKSSTVNAILKDLNCEAMWINASIENGIDTIRGKIMSFASSQSFDDKRKVVVLDECLRFDEKVIFGTLETPEIKRLDTLNFGETYNCISLNLETGEYENDTCEKISEKIDDIFEVTLENGESIYVTKNHPFILDDLSQKSIEQGLCIGDDVKFYDKN